MHHHHHHPDALLFLLLTVLPALVLLAYLVAAYRSGWSLWRSLLFATGIGLIMLAGSPPIAHWAHEDLRGHMAQHLLLGMLAPLGLVLGAPVTLMLRVLPQRGGRWVAQVLRLGVVRVLSHPAVAAVLDVGAMFVLYLTPLYVLSLTSPALHLWLHLHFLVAGCLFTWSIAGPDPAPHRPGPVTRLVVLVVAFGAHALLGKIMYGYHYPRGTAAPIEEIEAAAQWMYYGGDLAEILLAIAFFAAWFRNRDRGFRTSSTPVRSGLAGSPGTSA